MRLNVTSKAQPEEEKANAHTITGTKLRLYPFDKTRQEMKNFRFELIGETVESNGEEDEDEVPAEGTDNGGAGTPGTDETTTPTLITALFKFHSGQEEEVKAEAGAVLTAPANTEGYKWRPTVPVVMPAENTTYTEIPSTSVDWGQGPGGDDDDL